MAEGSLLGGDLRLAGRLDRRFFALLRAIDESGSINRAARAAGYTYKGAWLVLDAAANLAHEALVARETGGSRLTDAGRALLAVWMKLQDAHADFLRRQEAWLAQQPAIAGTLRRLSMKTTARNQFAGKIAAIDKGPVTTRVKLALRAGQEIAATMTTEAATQMKLRKGEEAIALVKSSEIVLVADFAGFALSARNQLEGTISRVQKGAVTSLVGVTLPGGAIVTASVTNDAVDALALKVGQDATAVFKASSVMLAVPRR